LGDLGVHWAILGDYWAILGDRWAILGDQVGDFFFTKKSSGHSGKNPNPAVALASP
jgi:hypothetical protein